jgi:predicted RNase H-like HicB family nuclease
MRMAKRLTLEYWIDDGWFVGRLKEVPGVFSQGETLEELEENIQEAYTLMIETEPALDYPGIKTKEIEVAA